MDQASTARPLHKVENTSKLGWSCLITAY